MTIAILQIIAGLGILAFGGEIMVRGASALAVRLRLTPAVIGLTVMAVGTSLPELMVSVTAQVRDSADLSLGNVVGSNIFNIGMVLGACSLVRPLLIPGSTVRLEWPFMFASSCLLLLLARDRSLDQHEGGIFLASFTIFTVVMVILARRQVGAAEAESYKHAVEGAAGGDATKRALYLPIGMVILGGAALWFGAHWLIEGAQTVARASGVDERTISLTVLAAGTGLPELVATFVAVLHKKTDMAVGNIVGSNICNVLLVLGAVSVIKPLAVNPKILHWDIWWMLGISFVLGPFLLGNRLDRREGFVLLVGYIAYVVFLFR